MRWIYLVMNSEIHNGRERRGWKNATTLSSHVVPAEGGYGTLRAGEYGGERRRPMCSIFLGVANETQPISPVWSSDARRSRRRRRGQEERPI